MTEQEVFNTVWNHFVINRASASIDAWGDCAYRGLYGDRCAVGLFIPDEVYAEEMEGLDVLGVRELLGERSGAIPEGFDRLLDRLQLAHDTAAWNEGHGGHFNQEVEIRLRDIAERFDLEIPEAQV